jgi:transposase
MVGCDLHDRTMLLKIGRGRNKPQTMSVKNTTLGRQMMIAKLREFAGGGEVIFVYEASGQGFGLYDELTDAGITCFVLAPTKIVRSTQQKRQKTDEKDAEDLLDLLRAHRLAGNRLPTVWIPDLQTRDDRELVRTRLDLADKLTAVKTQTKGLLKRHRLARPEGAGKGWTQKYNAWLEGLVQEPGLGVGLRGALHSLLRQAKSLSQEIKLVDQEVLNLIDSPRYAGAVVELVKLKGVGVLTALVFLTEVGDLGRFENRRQISAYLGLVPSSHESGESNDRKGHITRQGPSRVRRALCQATWSRVRTDSAAQEVYARLVEKNPKHKKIAVVAAMRHLAVLMWHRGRDGTGGSTASTRLVRQQACSAPAG